MSVKLIKLQNLQEPILNSIGAQKKNAFTNQKTEDRPQASYVYF